ncbi:hypothetical protein DW842_19845 [Ruminococcus sp. AM36-17]|nr:hypothetical protein DW842_19845 [Ruminococcus sp. AM36-17]
MRKNIRLQNNASSCGLRVSPKIGSVSGKAGEIKNIAKKSAKIRLLFIFLSILYLTTKTDGFLTVRKKRLAASGYEAYLAEKFSASSRKAAALLLKHIRKGEKE